MLLPTKPSGSFVQVCTVGLTKNPVVVTPFKAIPAVSVAVPTRPLFT